MPTSRQMYRKIYHRGKNNGSFTNDVTILLTIDPPLHAFLDCAPLRLDINYEHLKRKSYLSKIDKKMNGCSLEVGAIKCPQIMETKKPFGIFVHF